jgi:hypothetical protein
VSVADVWPEDPPSDSRDWRHWVSCFVREEGFLLLALLDGLNTLDPSLVAATLLPVSMSAPARPAGKQRTRTRTRTRTRPRSRSSFSREGTSISTHTHVSKLERYWHAQRFKATYSSYRDSLRTIEVYWTGRGLFQASFVRPRQCQFLTREMKRRIQDRVDLSSDNKVAAFLSELRVASAAMHLQMTLRDNSASFLLMFQTEISMALVLVAFLINFMLMMSIEKGYFSDREDPQFSSPTFERHARWLIYFQCILEVYSTTQVLTLWVPLAVQEWQHNVDQGRKKHSRVKLTRNKKTLLALQHFLPTLQFAAAAVIVNVIVQMRYWVLVSLIGCAGFFLRSLYHFLHEPFNMKSSLAGGYIVAVQTLTAELIASRLLFTLISLLCLDLTRPYWCSMMLLQLVENSKTLRNVIRAVTLPAYALLQSCLLGLICIFIFAIFGFYFFPDSFYNENQSVDECSNLLFCYATFLHNGLLNGGGIADHITGDLGHEPIFSDKAQFTSRVVYDIVFFVFISVLLLNIIFGIIIDTFGNLREIQVEELRLRTSFCFICGLPKEVFDTRANATAVGTKGGGGGGGHEQMNFAGHIKREHHMWDYLFYLIYIRDKPACNYSGMESHVAGLIEKDDFSWVPVGVARGVTPEQEQEQGGEEEAAAGRAVAEAIAASLQELPGKLHVGLAGVVQREMREVSARVQQLAADVTRLKSEVGGRTGS